MSKEALLAPGVNILANGVTAHVELKRPYEGVQAGNTAKHEAGHAFLMVHRGRVLRKASKIPNLEKGYLGITEGEVDTVSAMGPHSLGYSGTGQDRRVAEYLGDAGTAETVARETLYANWGSFQVVARAIEVEGEISGFKAIAVIEKNKNPDALVVMNGPFGTRSFVTSTKEADGYLIPLTIAETISDLRN